MNIFASNENQVTLTQETKQTFFQHVQPSKKFKAAAPSARPCKKYARHWKKLFFFCKLTSEHKMSRRRALTYFNCFCCSKTHSVDDLIEMGSNQLQVCEEMLEFHDLILDVCSLKVCCGFCFFSSLENDK